MKRRYVSLAIIILAVTIVAVVNGTAFIYRTLQGNVQVTDITSGQNEGTIAQYGMACTGFYVKGADSGNTIHSDILPDAGTNHDVSITSSGSEWYGVKVDWGDIACQWDNTTDQQTYTLYKSATINVKVTNGDWYFKDLLGFGYPSVITGPDTIYVRIKVASPLTNSNIDSAKLIIYDASTQSQAGVIYLRSNTLSNPIQLSPGDGFQIDLELSATGSVSSDSFTVLFYVSSSNEAPR
ncbi:hypothetical protein [Staphylothermus hellenicus]|uniref:Uncharacterized protein n=1 Tax=Staphylothermus hellenicus (strain DSM 12710 / JCM 10830 / BK20S6-10-b1 / P8) TaxID=591019 RepID=D7DAY4_STAHD|nr:hypothetical protein [Staphylothermus hellenicus]ADI31331.1 hypothetical protein Shell_0189 [Staphylothermus hellenicus DSM 12710]